MSHTRRVGAGLLVLLSAVVIGCGGGGGSSGNSGSPGGPGGPGPGGPAPGAVAGPDTRINTDTAGAELSLFPEICCDGNTLYVVWYDRRDGGLDIYFNVSGNGGATWKVRDIRLDTDDPGAAQSMIPQICCAGDAVYVVWYDERDGFPDIYFNRSLDRGQTWLVDDVRLDTDDAGVARSREPRICCDGDTVVVAWDDNRDGSWAVRANRSEDRGTSWLDDDIALDRGSASTNARISGLCCASARVHAVWTDDRDGGTAVYWNGSGNAGLTWGATDTRLDRSSGVGAAELPIVACTGDRVVVAWPDARNGARDIYVNRSVNGGGTWLASAVRVDRDLAGAGDSAAPALCVDGDRAYLVWQDVRGASADVYFSGSLDSGATWDAIDFRLDLATNGLAAAFRPRICCENGRLTVIWYDDRLGRFDVLVRHSQDEGATWSPELRMDTDDAGADHSLDPRVCCDGELVFAVWYDQRHGPGDVYFNAARFPAAL